MFVAADIAALPLLMVLIKTYEGHAPKVSLWIHLS